MSFYIEMEPFADGFRNYIKDKTKKNAEYLLVDKAQLLRLAVPEMVVLIGGLRVLGTNYKYTNYGVFTDRPGTLTNDFFINLLDMSINWKAADEYSYVFEGYDRKTGALRWTATRVNNPIIPVILWNIPCFKVVKFILANPPVM